MFTIYDRPRSFTPASAQWLLFLLGLAALDQLLAERGIPMLFYLLVQVAAMVGGVLLVVPGTVFLPASESWPVFIGAAVLLSVCRAAYSAYRPPNSNDLILRVDVLSSVCGLYLFSAFGLNKPLNREVLLLTGGVLICCLLMVSALRTGLEGDSVIRGSAFGGLLILLLIAGFCVLAASLLLGFGSGQIHSLVDFLLFLWSGISVVLSAIGNFFLHILAFLILLFSGKSVGFRTVTTDSGDSLVLGPAEETAGGGFSPILAVLLGVLAAAALFALCRALLRIRLKPAGRRRQTRVIRKSHFFSALLALLRRVAGFVSFEAAYLAGKHTPEGLYILARRACRRQPFAMKKRETAGMFLRRLDPEGLSALADCLDEDFYAGTRHLLTPAEYAAWAQAVRRAVEANRSLPKHPASL